MLLGTGWTSGTLAGGAGEGRERDDSKWRREEDQQEPQDVDGRPKRKRASGLRY